MNSTDRRELSERFADAIGSLFAHVYADLLDEWQAHGITMLQARILEALLRQGPARTTELAMRTSQNLPVASEPVNRLMNKGMVRLHEDPNQRGETICELTARGHQVAVKINSRPAETLAQIAEEATREDVALMTAGLEELFRQVMTER